jgi:hypothetical protein
MVVPGNCINIRMKSIGVKRTRLSALANGSRGKDECLLMEYGVAPYWNSIHNLCHYRQRLTFASHEISQGVYRIE